MPDFSRGREPLDRGGDQCQCHDEHGCGRAEWSASNRLRREAELLRDIVANRTPTWTGLDAPL